MPRRTISFTIKRLRASSLDKLVERLSREIRAEFARIEVKGDRLLVEIVGGKTGIRESVARIKALIRELEDRRVGGGLHVYSPRLIHREAGTAVPLDIVSEVLSREGYRARYTSEGLETNAPFEDVIEASSRVAEALRALEGVAATTSAKKALAAAAAATGLGVEFLVETASSRGFLVEDHRGRLTIKGSWRDTFKRLLEELGGG